LNPPSANICWQLPPPDEKKPKQLLNSATVTPEAPGQDDVAPPSETRSEQPVTLDQAPMAASTSAWNPDGAPAELIKIETGWLLSGWNHRAAGLKR